MAATKSKHIALTSIKHGGKSVRNSDGSYDEVKPMKTIAAGDAVSKSDFTDEQWAQLEEAGAVGAEGDVAAPTPQSTAGLLQGPPEEAPEAVEEAEG
jgi:hypothetical protein